MKTHFMLLLAALMTVGASAKEYHVSIKGNDRNNGSASRPYRTISTAAKIARPGDTITVYQGVYRERIDPRRGGISDDKRIVYQAAAGQKVIIKGSEVITGWQKVQNDTWKVTIANSFFGNFNPYNDEISGDWFDPKGRKHHTGAVYLKGHWLTEATTLEHVLKPVGQFIENYLARGAGGYLVDPDSFLVDLDSFTVGNSAIRVEAEDFNSCNGTKVADIEGGKCVGFIQENHWLGYEAVDFGKKTDKLTLVTSSANSGTIEARLESYAGEIIGSLNVDNTGGWLIWETLEMPITHALEQRPVSGKQNLVFVFKRMRLDRKNPKDGNIPLWFAQVDNDKTTLWAQFEGINPNQQNVEINVRQSVFYPSQTGINYLTVRGFTMMHAATPWSPPTAEQIGLIGTNWSKGWIIEDNDVSYSTCTGVTLGKHGDEFDNTSANTDKGYIETIERARACGWSKENIGHHLVRNNHISHCEQSGIVGSMGAVFSTVTGNTIHDINIRGLFGGAEMAGIKFHGAIDTLISRNHIYRCHGLGGIWLDWMAQGARVTGNLLHDNVPEDLFMEVTHGPFLVDNNLFLSSRFLRDKAQGGAYVHNLATGDVALELPRGRRTPFLKPHSTEMVGLHDMPGGDDRFYNNICIGHQSLLSAYDRFGDSIHAEGNVFLMGAKPSNQEPQPLERPKFNPGVELVEKSDGMYLRITLDESWARQQRPLVTTELLGKAKIPDLPYVQPDGSKYRLDTDYFGKKRNTANPFPGPFEPDGDGKLLLKVWPAAAKK